MEHQIQFVLPKIWSPIAGKLDEVARAILATMHNRHIGITPALARDLAATLGRSSRKPSNKSVWHRATARLVGKLYFAVQGAPGQSITATQRHGFLANTLPSYVILRLALPIVEQACRSLGRTCLFTQDETEVGITQADYDAYADALSASVAAIIDDSSEKLDIFWTERALTLAGQSRRMGQAAADVSFLPESDPAAAALFLRLKTEPRTADRSKSETVRINAPPPTHLVRRRKEGGIEGIHKTTKWDDLDDIRHSEFLNPEPVFLDNIYNVGFLAVKRPPKREQLRDVLLAALVPSECASGLQGAFLKACWFDLCVRFGRLLCQRGMLNSEFRFIEGNSLHQERTCVFQLRDLTELDLVQGPAFRHDFRISLGWLPPYLNRSAIFEHIRLPLEPAADDLHRIAGWMDGAWRGQREARDKGMGLWGRRAAPRLNVDDFARVHVMAVIPAHLRRSTSGEEHRGASALHQVQFRLWRGNSRGRQVSVTWLPHELRPSPEWVLDALGQLDLKIFPDSLAGGQADPPKLPEAEFAGALVGAWLDQLTHELLKGT